MKLIKVGEIAIKKEQERVIKKLKKKWNKMIKYFFESPYYQITKDTTKRFKEGEMFNDEIINAYKQILIFKNSDIYIFKTSFINLLEKYQNRPSKTLHFLGNYLL